MKNGEHDNPENQQAVNERRRPGPFTGKRHTNKTRAQISEKKMGHPVSNEAREKISKKLKGRKTSEQTRKRLSDALTGRTIPDETRKKMSDANMGHPVSPETQAKINESRRKGRLIRERLILGDSPQSIAAEENLPQSKIDSMARELEAKGFRITWE